jgi:hypothetical protein
MKSNNTKFVPINNTKDKLWLEKRGYIFIYFKPGAMT